MYEELVDRKAAWVLGSLLIVLGALHFFQLEAWTNEPGPKLVLSGWLALAGFLVLPLAYARDKGGGEDTK